MYCALLTGKEKTLHIRIQALRNSCKLLCPSIESFFSNPFILQLGILAGFILRCTVTGLYTDLFANTDTPVRYHKLMNRGTPILELFFTFFIQMTFWHHQEESCSWEGCLVLKEIPFCYGVDFACREECKSVKNLCGAASPAPPRAGCAKGSCSSEHILWKIFITWLSSQI